VLLGEPALVKGVPSFPAESFLMLGQDGFQAFESEKSASLADRNASPSSPLLVFPDGGYHVSRDQRFSVIFDAGPLGIAPAYGHGHADGLSFILHYHGKPVIVDPGTFVYNGPPVWRNYFRSTAAHNTVRIDNKDPIDPIETFRWSGPLKIEQSEPIQGKRWRILHAAVHWKQIVHRRYMIHLIDQGVIILDRVEGPGEHLLEWRLHSHSTWIIRPQQPGPTAGIVTTRRDDADSFPLVGARHTSPKGDTCVAPTRNALNLDSPSHSAGRGEWLPDSLDRCANSSCSHSCESGNPAFSCQSFTAEFGTDRLDISFLSRHPSEASILHGSMVPMAGWYSRYYGSKAPSPTLMMKMSVQLPATLLTVFKPSAEKLTLPRDLPHAPLGSDMFDLLLSH